MRALRPRRVGASAVPGTWTCNAQRVVDVWESSGHFDRFVDERLGAAIGEALGDRAEQPERSDAELHTFYTR